MKIVFRNIAAVLFGIVLGSLVNMALITLSSHVIPPPVGVNPADLESIRASLHRYEPKHFLFPFLAHAFGALVGAFLAALIAAKHRQRTAIGISAFFLLGGIAACFLIPAPKWFMALDLLVAYLPMGWLGAQLAEKIRPSRA